MRINNNELKSLKKLCDEYITEKNNKILRFTVLSDEKDEDKIKISVSIKYNVENRDEDNPIVDYINSYYKKLGIDKIGHILQEYNSPHVPDYNLKDVTRRITFMIPKENLNEDNIKKINKFIDEIERLYSKVYDVSKITLRQ